jgi:uncharacterized iron-regulated protein
MNHATVTDRIKKRFPLIRKVLLILPLVIIVFQACSQNNIHADGTKVFRLSDRTTITYQQMIDDLRNVDLIFVGEVHTEASHHRLQLDVIRALQNLKDRQAVGFEMFIAANQNILDRWIAGSLSSDEFIKAYYENWNYPWTLYRDIFLYLREQKIPAIGLNISPEITRKISTQGFSSLTKEELRKLPPETGCAVDEKYMKFIRMAYSMHGHGGKQFVFFCEAQLVWDQVMARNLVAYLRQNPGMTVVTLAGNGHAWKRGIPAQVRLLSDKTTYRVIMPSIPRSVDPEHISAEEADYILLQ